MRDGKADRKQYEIELQWENIIELLRYNREDDLFDTPKVKTLIAETWQYFIDTIEDNGINSGDIPIIGAMYVLMNRTYYPKGITQWEYDAFIAIVKGLLNTLRCPDLKLGYRGNLHEGYISVEEFEHCFEVVHISEFEMYLAKLAETYYEDNYFDIYDKNGNKLED